jgi:hypothetical protein
MMRGLGGSTGALEASVAPSSIYGFNYGYGTVYTSDAVTVSITGGQAPYTIVWTRVSGPTSISPVTQGGVTTGFKASINNTVVSGDWKAVVDSNTFTVTLESFSYPPGGGPLP